MLYCCTAPLPTGVGNISVNPQLASASHLSASSPCRGAGSSAYVTATDIDGEAWASPPSIGCDEYHVGAVTGPLNVDIVATLTSVMPGYPARLTGLIDGRTTGSVWDFGDGVLTTNQPYVSHAWTTTGDYPVVLRAYNESQPTGISATVTVHVVEQPVHYVDVNNGGPAAPFTSWATAATNIQDAVDAATVPGALVLVTNGTYASGGRTVANLGGTNRVVVNKLLTLQSVNGPQFTAIQGYQVPGSTNGDAAIRCVYLTNGASLSGFTLTNGATAFAAMGGGVWCVSTNPVVTNCVLVGNSSSASGGGAFRGTLFNCALIGNSGSFGGGAFSGTLNNCVLTRNSASTGGGVYSCTLNNCTVANNSASSASGGVGISTLNNCIVYYNTAPSEADPGTLNYSCTTPLPTKGIGNITNAPLFVDEAGGNLRLQSNSPCINAGLNTYVRSSTDSDGNARVVGGMVDIGAYEFQSPSSVLSYAWAQQYGLPTDGSADYSDSDADHLNNWQEWIAGTVPIDALSVLRLLSPTNDGSGITISWQSVNNRKYWLERSTGLGAQPLFLLLKSNIVGQASMTIYTDTNAVGSGPFFYRVGVQQ